MNQLHESGLRWLAGDGEYSDIVLSTRIRLARNLQGCAFGSQARVNDRISVLDRMRRGRPRIPSLATSELREIGALTERERRILLERRIASRELLGDGNGAGDQRGAGIVLSPDLPWSVMVNEEDHFRLQILLSGLRLRDAWNRLDLLDDEVGNELPFAFHHEFGFLTSCPTNVGTGLRASVLMHLPGLVLTKEIGKVLHGLAQVGLTYRGLYGEGSEVVGNFFQLSNQTTLGRSEEDLVDHIDRIVRQIIQYEQQARQILLRDAGGVTEDKIWRAYGLLRYARALSFEELMNLLSGVRLGVSLKLLPGPRVTSLNRIMIFSQPAHLDEAAGRDLTPAESDAHRATLVRRILAADSGTAGEAYDPTG